MKDFVNPLSVKVWLATLVLVFGELATLFLDKKESDWSGEISSVPLRSQSSNF